MLSLFITFFLSAMVLLSEETNIADIKLKYFMSESPALGDILSLGSVVKLASFDLWSEGVFFIMEIFIDRLCRWSFYK